MRGLSQIIRVGPKCRDICPYKWETVGDLTQGGEEAMQSQRQIVGCSHKPGNASSCSKGKVKEIDSPLELSERNNTQINIQYKIISDLF